MSKSWRTGVRFLLAAAAVLGGWANGAKAADGQLSTFTKADGQTYFALCVTPTAEQPASVPHDIAVVVDTSASQINEYRGRSLAALEALLASLDPADRVQLLAADLEAVALTEQFVASDSAAMDEALAALRLRTPLGASDMPNVLRQVIDLFDSAASHERAPAIVYIGDGLSTANLLSNEEMEALVDDLVERRISVSSFAVGSRVDGQLLGALANHTGGMVGFDAEEVTPQQNGAALAAAARAAVVWPTAIGLPEGFTEAYPARFPPLRFDRDSVIIGICTPEAVTLKLTAELQGEPVQMQWSAEPQANEDFAFLPELVAAAAKDHGMSLPTVGSAGLNDLRRIAHAEAYNLTRLGQQALAVGSLDQAQQLIDEALAKDPVNPEALAVRDAIAKARNTGSAGSRDLELVNYQVVDPVPADAVVVPPAEPAPAEQPADVPPAPPGGEPVPPPAAQAPADGDFIEQALKDREIMAAIMQANVQTALNDARGIMSTDPETAINNLKLILEQIRRAPELDENLRVQLVAQLEAALRAARREAEAKAHRDLMAQQVAAAAAELEEINRELTAREARIDAWMDQFNSLLREGRFREARDAAMLARAEDPTVPALHGAVETAVIARHVAESQAIQAARWEGWLDTMMQVEYSGIPFPDSPAIVYPEAREWQLLTERRKKWLRVDVAQTGAAEARILEALDEPTELEFIEAPLTDVVDYLRSYHKMEIQLDTRGLEELGIGSDTPITRNLKGVSLRSGLRLMLEDLDLAYVIRDEVLLVTTRQKAEEYRTTRVYPVADLVIPIPEGGLSGFGGLGGAMGGGGGGLGGGGGGLGGGLGGGGGGMFAVKDNVRRDELKLTGDDEASQPAVAPQQPSAAAAAETEAEAAPAQPIGIDLSSQVDPGTLWNDHFASTTETAETVRATARMLMGKKRFDHVIAMIEAALRHDHAQPWMFEALSLAMRADGRSSAEIERVLMSSVDFSSDTAHLIGLAKYIADADTGDGRLTRRGMKLVRQVSEMNASRSEPFAIGMQLAERLGDAEGIQWATVGVLSQAWPQKQQHIYERAQRLAEATLVKLRAAGQTEQADAFQKALDMAEVRDCVIVVSWTGDADVDLFIEEPTGTICSYRNPRTTSGGLLLVDGATAGVPADDLKTEVYVCPQAFAGNYRLLVQRVWGNVTADAVTVDIFAHKGTSYEQHVHEKVTLGDQTAMAFNLEGGRRAESLEEYQVANAAATQAALGRHIVAQQLAAAESAPTLSSFLAQAGELDPEDLIPIIRGGVGYQPVIITLPIGQNFAVTAVVSHDRRYVRVTPQFIDSSIPEVRTFNFVSGMEGMGAAPGGL